MPLASGTLLLERYRIERILGQGGMGAVYLATDEHLGVQVAVKENLNLSPESERQFKREATLLAGLRHHHLPRVTNHFILAGQQYLVMDFVDGEDLKQRLTRQGPLPVADVVRWAGQICDALIYLHGLQPPVLHRDIKPANIRLTSGGDAMLVDFGIAKSSAAGQKTTTSAVALTPGFAPPEQYGLARTEPRTDQYALAATLYNLLTNQPPPDSMDRLLGNVTLPAPQSWRPDLPPHLAAALERGLEVKLEQRFANMQEFKAALAGAASPPPAAVSASGASAPAPASTAPVARPRNWLPLAIGGLLVSAALIGGLAFGLPALTAARATATPLPPSATLTLAPTLAPTQPPPSATAVPPSDTPAPPSATPTQAPSATPLPPTDTATPEPSPTVAGTAVGGGGRIAFISNRDGQRFQVYSMNSDGGDVRQLTSDDRDKWSPTWKLADRFALPGPQLAWSPDGRQLIYVAEGAQGGLDLWVINADGSQAINLTAPTRAGENTGNNTHPAWCSTGWVAFTSTRVNNVPQIFMLRPEDRQARNFSATHSSPTEYGVTWFPDCLRFLYLSGVNGGAEIWRVYPFKQTYATLWQTFPKAAEQSNRVFLSDRAGYNAITEDAALSPDGARLVYTRQSPDSNEIVLTTVSDSQLTMKIQQLTTTRNNNQPVWSPDGHYIAFVSKRDGGRADIFRMDINGGGQVNLTNDPAIDLSPAWQPAEP